MKKMLSKMLALWLCLCLSTPVLVSAASTVGDDSAKAAITYHQVVVTIRYLDGSRRDVDLIFDVINGGKLEQKLNIMDGYDLVNAGIRAFPSFDMDMETKILSLDPVEQDYEILLEFDKAPAKNHNVSITTHYMDSVMPDETVNYEVEPGAPFKEYFKMLDGYEICNTSIRAMPTFDIDSIEGYVSIDAVDRDYDIILDLQKEQCKVTIKTELIDTYTWGVPTLEDWVEYGGTYQAAYKIPEGYQIVNYHELPSNLIIDPNKNSLYLQRILYDYDITIKLARITYDIDVETYLYGKADPIKIDTYQAPYGEPFSAPFVLEQGQGIKKVTFNAPGIFIDRTNNLINIDSVTSPITIKIYVG